MFPLKAIIAFKVDAYIFQGKLVCHIRLVLSSQLGSILNPLYTGGLFHCYMLDESICHIGVSGLFYRFYSILMENPV